MRLEILEFYCGQESIYVSKDDVRYRSLWEKDYYGAVEYDSIEDMTKAVPSDDGGWMPYFMCGKWHAARIAQ